MSIVDLLALFADPASLKELTVSQKMVASLATTLLGMGITFLALISLQIVITLMARFVPKGATVKEKVSEGADVKEISGNKAEDECSQEVVAAISVSLAVLLQRSPRDLVIKNIRKVEETAPVWSKVGLVEQTDKYL